MGHLALTHVMLGRRPPVEPGEPIPETYIDTEGREQPVDFERLIELGAAEKVEAPKRRAAKTREP